MTWTRINYCSFTITQGATNFGVNDKLVLTSVAASSYSCAPGASSGLQSSSPISYCAENGGSFTSYPTGENWSTGTYMAAKGLMGASTTPVVMWRLPSMNDYEQADIDGIRMVLPDMGIVGTSRPVADASTGGNSGSNGDEWTATLFSGNRAGAWIWSDMYGNLNTQTFTTSYPIHCVGR